MKRKQIYLTEQLDRKLSELASSRGVSQAEIIREGLAMYLIALEDQDEEWKELIRQMLESPYENIQWSRNDLYADRFHKHV